MPKTSHKRALEWQAIVSRNLKVVRRMRGLTQEAAAQASSFSLDNVRRWESGARTIDVGSLKVLSDAYGVPIADFFAEPLPPYMARFLDAAALDSN